MRVCVFCSGLCIWNKDWFSFYMISMQRWENVYPFMENLKAYQRTQTHAELRAFWSWATQEAARKDLVLPQRECGKAVRRSVHTETFGCISNWQRNEVNFRKEWKFVERHYWDAHTHADVNVHTHAFHIYSYIHSVGFWNDQSNVHMLIWICCFNTRMLPGITLMTLLFRYQHWKKSAA